MNAKEEGPANGVVRYLRCPNCHRSLEAARRSLRCPAGHCFDLARQGYVDLSGGRVTHPGDTADMVAARMELTGAGHLDSVTEAIVSTVPPGILGLAVDVGAGTGHHLAALLAARPGLVGLAVDVSKAALRRAARIGSQIGERPGSRAMAVRADVWRGLPVADASAQIVLDVFAPRSGCEFHRVLRPDGALIVVTPTRDHLGELVAALGLLAVDPRKSDRLAAGLTPWFEPGDHREVTTAVRLSRGEALSLVRMGPSAWHLDQEILRQRLAGLPEPLTATISVQVSTWHPVAG